MFFKYCRNLIKHNGSPWLFYSENLNTRAYYFKKGKDKFKMTEIEWNKIAKKTVINWTVSTVIYSFMF